MPRKKLKNITEVDSLPNVLHFDVRNNPDAAGDSAVTGFFDRKQPLTLEVGCGRGDYSLSLALRFPERNFVGLDTKGARLCTGAKAALNAGVANVVFLRGRAEDLACYFKPGEVEEIWIPFPDPHPKKKGIGKRLTGPGFLAIYRSILKQGGKVHLKTDDAGFWDSTLTTLATAGIVPDVLAEDLGALPQDWHATEIQTKYEREHLARGRLIRYLVFSFDRQPAPPLLEAQR